MTAGPVIAITVNNRPQYLKPVLESWAMARGIGKAEMIFRCEPGCDEAVALCDQVTYARKATTIVNPERFGVLVNPWHAMEAAFATGAPFAILGEEDNCVSDDTLEMFAWAQREYAGDPDVVAVCAGGYGADYADGGEPNALTRDTHFSPIVWGTWADRWKDFFRETWDFTYANRGWDWNVNRLIGEQGKHVVIAMCSRSLHIGELGGTHCSPDFYPETVASSFTEQFGQQDYREVTWRWAPGGTAVEARPLSLNLGAGSDLATGPGWEGWVNHDLVALPGIDVAWDLEQFPWPWPDGCVDRIRAYDVWEHLDRRLEFIRECWRILKPGGILDIHTCHWQSENAYTDPDHRHAFTEKSADYWCPGTYLHDRYGGAYAQGCHFVKVSAGLVGTDVAFVLKKI